MAPPTRPPMLHNGAGGRADSYYEYLLKRWIQRGKKDKTLLQWYIEVRLPIVERVGCVLELVNQDCAIDAEPPCLTFEALMTGSGAACKENHASHGITSLTSHSHSFFLQAMRSVRSRLVQRTVGNLWFVSELDLTQNRTWPKMDHLACFLPGAGEEGSGWQGRSKCWILCAPGALGRLHPRLDWKALWLDRLPACLGLTGCTFHYCLGPPC